MSQLLKTSGHVSNCSAPTDDDSLSRFPGDDESATTTCPPTRCRYPSAVDRAVRRMRALNARSRIQWVECAATAPCAVDRAYNALH